MVSLRQVRELMARRAAGESLTADEQAALVRDARILRRRLDRLRALDPEVFGDIELTGELDELAEPPILTGSA